MTFIRLAALSVALAAHATAPAAPAKKAAPVVGSLTVTNDQNFVLDAMINGQPVRLRVDPAIGNIILNPEAAARLSIDSNFLQRLMKPTMLVGPHQIKGSGGGGSVTIGSWSGKRPLFWFERDIVTGADGVIGIADLPHENVSMQIRPATARDQTFTYEVDPTDFLGLVYRMQVAGKEVLTRFSLNQSTTQASASAGAILAAEHGGTWKGEPELKPIILGVSRPARPLSFTKPLSVNGMAFNQLLIRTSDYRGAYVLPTDPPEDPNEIVVTGSKAKGKALLRLTISSDRLQACSSISYHREAKRLTLVCPAT
jgi:hypothetical protein